MDTVDAQTRSQIMSRVQQRNTKPELVLRRALHARGLRYRLHDRKLPGSPDLVFPKFKAVVFVHGCFWHAHENCKYATVPSSRREFWTTKLATNRARDERCRQALEQGGWRVLVVWECVIKGPGAAKPADVAVRIEQWLHSEESYGEIVSSRRSLNDGNLSEAGRSSSGG